ncbi:MAG: phosphatase [Blautia sp.]|nr:phosphatase [Blautia sp.]
MEYVLDSHTHTVASGHAYNTVKEMVHAAAEKKLQLLGITEHAEKMPGSCNNIYFRNLKVLPRRMEGVELLFGVEANIMDFDGGLDVPDDLLSAMDVVIVSLHPVCLDAGTKEQNTNAYLRTMENPYVNIIGHPDDGRYPVDYERLVLAAKKHHVLLELNNHSLDPGCGRENARIHDIEMLRLCMKYQVPIIMNSDAHWCDDIADTRFSMPLIKELGFPEELIVNRSVEAYKAFLTKKL